MSKHCISCYRILRYFNICLERKSPFFFLLVKAKFVNWKLIYYFLHITSKKSLHNNYNKWELTDQNFEVNKITVTSNLIHVYDLVIFKLTFNCHDCHDRMIAGFDIYLYNQYLSPLTLWVRIPLMAKCTQYSIQLYVIKVCQWLATSRLFSQGTLISSTNDTDRHNITEVLLKMGTRRKLLTCRQTLTNLII